MALVDIEKRQADRLRVMKAVFDASRGSESAVVSGRQLRSDLQISGRDLAYACKYLEGEGLITATYERPPYSDIVYVRGVPHGRSTQHRTPYWTPHEVHITHHGVKEMERSLATPSEPTQYFPPIAIISVHGDVIGSTLANASPGAYQQATASELDLDAIREFVRQCGARAAELRFPSTAGEELAAEIATLEAQLESPKPKRHIVAACLVSIREILESGAGGVAAAELLGLLQHLHL